MTSVSRHSLRIILATGIAALLAPTSAKATSYTYTGPGAGTGTNPLSGTFNTSDSWLDNTIPEFNSTTDLIFNFTAGTATAVTATNDVGTITLNSLSVTNNKAAITITGGTLNFAADGAELPTIVNAATSTQAFGILSSVTLGANFNLTNNATNTASQIQFGNTATAGFGNINLGAFTMTLNATSAAGYQFSQNNGSNRGVISGTGGIIQNSTSAGTTFAFFGASTFSGGYTLNSGQLVIGTNSIGTAGAVTSGSIGTGILTINGGIVRATSNGSRVTHNDVVVAGNFTLGEAATPTGMNLAGNATLTGNRIITVVGGGSTADLTTRHMMSGVIGENGGSFGFEKAGSGTLVVSGANTYTGATTITNGALIVAGDAPSGAAGTLGNATTAVTLGGAGTVAGNNVSLLAGIPGATPGASTITIARDISVLNGNSSGVTTLGGNTDTGVVFAGNVSLAKSVLLASSSTGPRQVNFTGVVSGAAGVTKSGSGILRLSGTNTYTGPTTIRNGTLLAGGNVTGSTDGVFGNAAGAIVLGDGTSTLAADNLTLGIDGAFTIGRDITVNASNTTGLSTLTALNAAASTATYGGNVTIAKGIVLANATVGATTLFTGAISDGAGSFGVTISGPGTVEFGGAGVHSYDGGTTVSSGTLLLNRAAGGNNTLMGAVTISGGTLSLGANEQLPDSTVLTLSGGTFDAAGRTETILDLNYTGGTILNGGNLTITGSQDLFLFDGTSVAAPVAVNRHILYLGSTTAATVNAALALDNDATHDIAVNDGSAAIDLTFNAAITNDGSDTPTSLIKKGAGTVKFNVANTFGGAGKTLEIQAGVVEVNADNQFGNIANTVTLNGGTLRFAGGFATARTFAFGVNNGNLETPTGITQSISSIGGAGNLTKTGAGELIVGGDNSATYTGTTTINAGTLTISTLNNLLGNATNDLVLNGGALKVAGGVALDAGKTITVGASGGTIQIEPSFALDLAAAGNLAGGGVLTKTGAGVLLIRDVNAGLTAGAAVTLSAGALDLRNAQSLGNAVKATVTLSGGQLQLANDVATSFSNPVVISSGTGTIQSDVATSGAAAVAHTLGTLSLGGTLLATAGTNATGTSGIIFGATTLTANATINSDSASVTTGTVAMGGNTLTVTGARTTQFGAVSGGPGAGNTAITKNGNGVLVLGSNTFTGNVVVNGGIARGNAVGAFGNSANVVRVNSGGTVGMGINSIPNALEFNGGTLASTGVTTGTWNGATGATPSITFLADTVFNLWDPLSPATDADVNLGSGNGTTGVVTSTVPVNITVNANATNTTFATQKKLRFQNTTNSGNATGTLTVNPNAIAQIRGGGTVNALGSGVLIKLNTGVNLTTPENAGRFEFAAESDTIFGNDFEILSDSTIGVARITSATGRLMTANNLSIGNHTLAVVDATGATGSGYNLAFAGTTTLSGSPTFHTLRTLTLGNITDGAGSFGFTKSGSGTLILNSASNTFDGDITVNAGTVNVGVNEAVPDNVKINIVGGTFTFSNGTNTSRSDTVANISMTSGALRTANGTTPTPTQVTVANTLEIAGGDFQVNTGSMVSANKVILSGGVQNVHVIGGNSTVNPAELIVGAGGLEFTGTQLRMNLGAASGNLGSRVTLNGNVSTFASTLESGFWGNSATGTFGVREINVGTGTRAFFIDDGAAANDLRIDFPLVGAANVVKIGEGRMQLNAANSFSGTTTITQGTLGLGASATLAGSPSVNVGVGATFDVSAKAGGYNVLASQSLKVDGDLLGSANVSGTLTGTGTISQNVSVLTAGALAPGASPGVLDIGGTLSFSDNSIFNVEIGGATPGDATNRHDQVNVGLGVTVGIDVALNLSLTGGYTPTLSDSFFILTRGDAVDYTSFFLNAPEGASVELGNGYSGTITYTANWMGDQLSSELNGGNDVAIFAVVPEPGSAILLLGGVALVANRRRRKS